MGWATYSPDNARVLVANNGILTLYDAASGDAVSTVVLLASLIVVGVFAARKIAAAVEHDDYAAWRRHERSRRSLAEVGAGSATRTRRPAPTTIAGEPPDPPRRRQGGSPSSPYDWAELCEELGFENLDPPSESSGRHAAPSC